MPAEVEEILWRSRADMWACCPDAPAGGQPLLDSYFSTRAASFPGTPVSTWHRLAALTLGNFGAAPGADNHTYEVYHFGVNFIVHLVAQAMCTAHLAPGYLSESSVTTWLFASGF